MSSIYTVTLPDIGEGVVEGEVIEWLKKEGESVAQDEPVVVVMTDKATVELPAPHPGILQKQHYKPGEIAHLDQPLYDLAVDFITTTEEQTPPHPDLQELPKRESEPIDKGVHALPATRHLAKQMGVPLSSIQGTGSDGRITNRDVIESVQEKKIKITPPLSLPTDESQPLSGIRNLMAKKMAESKRMAPHFSYFERADATRLVQLRENFKQAAANEGIRVTYVPFFIRALSLTIDQHPYINCSVDVEENALIFHKEQHIGIAMSTPAGLVVPVLRNVEKMGLQDIIRGYDALYRRVTSGEIKPSEMKNSTITLSNFGVLGGGGRWATPIINYPEVAILAVARIFKEPVVKKDKVVVRETLNLSWSFDHRVIDGNIAAAASASFVALLNNPAKLL